MAVHVFIGPTLSERVVTELVPDAIVHPPVAHGDLLRLTFSPGDVVVLVDGYYHHSAAVRHKEILVLLTAGVSVIGCSSMGALRAAELYPYGMIGHGKVFELYRHHVVDGDDEVAVSHGQGPDYRVLSVPLINVRHGVDAARKAGAIEAETATRVFACARALPYASRTWLALERACPDGIGALRAYLASHPAQADIKAADAVDTLRHLNTLVGSFDPGSAAWVHSDQWRTPYLQEWQATFEGETVDGIHVGRGAIAHFVQIYDEDFPQRWRRHALRGVAGTSVSDRDVEDAALAAAARVGLTPESTSREQLAAWLTPDEMDELSPDRALVLTLVRSYRSCHSFWNFVVDTWDPSALVAARLAVAECSVINAEVGSWRDGQDIGSLTPATLQNHLSQVWNRSPGDVSGLLAAARDRAFPSVNQAVAAVRPLFLRSHFRLLGLESIRARPREQ